MLFEQLNAPLWSVIPQYRFIAPFITNKCLHSCFFIYLFFSSTLSSSSRAISHYIKVSRVPLKCICRVFVDSCPVVSTVCIYPCCLILGTGAVFLFQHQNNYSFNDLKLWAFNQLLAHLDTVLSLGFLQPPDGSAAPWCDHKVLWCCSPH